MASATMKAGDLTVVVGDNAAEGQHRPGYNGIWSLTHTRQPISPFVPTVAGMNLEHIFDGDRDEDNKMFFEPRNAPMTLKKIDATKVELHQPPTPTFKLESWTTFALAPPDAVDFHFRCIARQHVFRHGYIGLFWASYIFAPEDKSMYFLGGIDRQRGWTQLCTPQHNHESTVCKQGHRVGLTFSKHFRNCLHRNLSLFTYDEPFFYGHVRGMTLLYLFDLDERLRLTHSPSGGGYSAMDRTSNPAWDYQFIIPKYEVDTEYGFRARLVYRPRMSRDDVLKENEAWRKTLKP